MLVQSLIERKRDGATLSADNWRALVTAYVREEIPDYQMSALLMAVVWRGLSPGELAALTGTMLESGSRLDFGRWEVPRVDKHSTGGVGDKVSLVLAPLVASCGVAVPMMSGRGLGHTGGTVDKLESIPGFRTDMGLAAVRAQVERIGLAMFAQGDEIAPADRKLYALRDVTGTVASVPLIAASIMSKKLAEGLDGLLLDVKAGSGAFMTEPAQALELARTMVGIGDAHGCRTTAFITAMDRPLGRAIGNALEVEEALLALEGKGPDDLQLLVRAFAVEMM
ncbi:MAG: thymidine phosphorylase, partial [Gemmatimonadota bacterium]|nr:thymidine phosphorylase [Gemmatimonadota bacterium]